MLRTLKQFLGSIAYNAIVFWDIYLQRPISERTA